nr:mitogen-activated protein kinase kinase 2-like [Ipomoea batatas]
MFFGGIIGIFGGVCRTESGTFKDGNLLVNKKGIRIISENQAESSSAIQPSDNQLCLTDFESIKVIGKGNSGIVWLVQHKWTQQLFALKVIQMNIEEPSRKHLAQELRINHSSQCPYVVICYQAFFDNGSISMILEYMAGGSLGDFLKIVKKIPEPYIAAICKQVLKGLWYLHHEKHIIHRDLKLPNLLINHRGDVKITDFGVSVILESTSGAASTFIGTYNYMSPERISGKSHGFRSDIWSLGLVLLECATGDFPYSPPQGEEGWTNVFELMETIVTQPEPFNSPFWRFVLFKRIKLEDISAECVDYVGFLKGLVLSTGFLHTFTRSDVQLHQYPHGYCLKLLLQKPYSVILESPPSNQPWPPQQ